MSRDVAKFADDKLFSIVKSKADCKEFHGDLITVGECIMKCRVDKSCTVHGGGWWGGGNSSSYCV